MVPSPDALQTPDAPDTVDAPDPPDGTAAADLRAAPFRIAAHPTERELLAKYFRTFGDPTRLHILELLERHGELSVGEIAAETATSQPRTSAHLACLRWCGFVSTRREHRTVHYAISDDRIGALLGIARELLATNAEHVAACRRIDGC